MPIAASNNGDLTRTPAATRSVEVQHASKGFAGAQALIDVSLKIASGHIHALVGENGAGKSTLGRIIGGALAPDEGTILVDGKEVSFRHPRDALTRGIALVHQEIMVVPSLSVLDNVFLGTETTTAGWVQLRSLRQRFRTLVGETGFDLDPDVKVSTLGVGEQQKVEILRAIVRNAWLIVMDEPTAALTDEESVRLIAFVRHLRDRGLGFLYITHKLEEALAVAETVTVLKNACHVSTAPAAEEDVDSLVTKMVGRPLSAMFPAKRQRSFSGAPAVLSVSGLTQGRVFQDVSFEIHAGEIVGMAGLVGSGRSEVAQAIFGAGSLDEGTVQLLGEPVRIRSPRHAAKHGIVLVPESRKDQGLIMSASVRANLMLPSMAIRGFCRPIRPSRETVTANSVAKSVDVRMESVEIGVSMLSGGNQQKVAIGKWLVHRPLLLIADQPTRGVDVGARLTIYELLHRLADEGLGVLLISNELEEVMGMADRILVMHRGRMVAELPGHAEENDILNAAFGRYQGGNALS